MKHFEIHALSTVEDLHSADDAGLIDSSHHLLFGVTCDDCVQMILLEKNENVFIVVDENSSKLSCTTCLTDVLLDGILRG
jgi:hypothetical protein